MPTYDHKVANLHEKPPENMRVLMANHSSPGNWVLVLGAGAGGEVLGAINAGLNVDAIERDARQFEGLRARLTQMQVDQDRKLADAEQKSSASNAKKKARAAKNGDEPGTPVDEESEDSRSSNCVSCGVAPAKGKSLAMCSTCNVPIHTGCMVSLGSGSDEVKGCSEVCLKGGK